MKRFAYALLAWILTILLLLTSATAEVSDTVSETMPATEDELILTEEGGVPENIEAPEEAGETLLSELEGAGDADAALIDLVDADPSDDSEAVDNGRSSAKTVKKLDDKAFIREASAMLRDYKGIADVSANSPDDYATARLIVRAKGELPDLSEWNVADMVRDENNLYLIQFYTPGEARQCAEHLSTLPGVKHVWPDRIVHVNDKGASKGGAGRDVQANRAADHMSWGASDIHADDYAEDLVRRKKTPRVVVAVLDTGVYTGSIMFDGRLVEGYDFINGTSRMTDENGHGTNVAGIIADCTWGLNVKIMPIRILDGYGSGSQSAVILGVKYAMIHGADVINMSLGGYMGKMGPFPEDEEYLNAIKKGIVVVVAAGNDEVDTKYVTPSHLKKLIAVAAVDKEHKRPFWSNYGKSVDIAAPGVDIRSGGQADRWATLTMSGTSQATPHVAAAAAMLLCENPRLTPAQVESMLRSTATDLGKKGWDKYYGAGLLNLESFVQTYGVDYHLTGGRGKIEPQIKKKGKQLTLRKGKPKFKAQVYFRYCGGEGEETGRKVKAKFVGWNTKADGSGEAYKPGGKYRTDASATLYAQWKYGRIGQLPTPTREGYTFVGWYTEVDGGEKVTAKTVTEPIMFLYAHWEPVAESE